MALLGRHTLSTRAAGLYVLRMCQYLRTNRQHRCAVYTQALLSIPAESLCLGNCAITGPRDGHYAFGNGALPRNIIEETYVSPLNTRSLDARFIFGQVERLISRPENVLAYAKNHSTTSLSSIYIPRLNTSFKSQRTDLTRRTISFNVRLHWLVLTCA